MIRSKGNTINKAHDIIRGAENNQSVLSPIENLTNDASTQVKPENKIACETNDQVTDTMIEKENHSNNDKMVTSTSKCV